MGLLKAGLDPDRFYCGSPPPSWALLSNRPCQVGMKGALMFLGWDWVVSGEGGGGGQFPGRRGQALWGSWGGSLSWCCSWQLQFHWPLFPTGLVPSPRNGNSGARLKEDRVGTSAGEGAWKGCRWGEIQSGVLLSKTTLNPFSHITIPFWVAFLLGAQGGCM